MPRPRPHSPLSLDFTLHKSMLEEVEETNDPDQLKKIIRTMRRKNAFLSRETKHTLETLEYQKRKVEKFQNDFNLVLYKNSDKILSYTEIIVREILQQCTSIMQLQNLFQTNGYEGKDRENFKEMQEIVNSVPQKDLHETRAELLKKIENLKYLRAKRLLELKQYDHRPRYNNVDEDTTEKRDPKRMGKKGPNSKKVKRDDPSTKQASQRQASKKKVKLNHESATKIPEQIHLKDARVVLSDFMFDFSEDQDPYVVQFKERVAAFLSDDSDSESETDPKPTTMSGVGPHTPPSSPPYSEESGPHTPPYSEESGPHTPPLPSHHMDTLECTAAISDESVDADISLHARPPSPAHYGRGPRTPPSPSPP